MLQRVSASGGSITLPDLAFAWRVGVAGSGFGLGMARLGFLAKAGPGRYALPAPADAGP